MVLALLVMSVSVLLVTRVMTRTMVQSKLGKVFVDREQAKMLALSGIQVAMSLLDTSDLKKEEEKITHILSVTNVEHSYELSEAADGIEGEIALTIFSETGKIQASALYDSKQKKMTQYFDALKKTFQELDPQENLSESIENFFKERKNTLFDVTELLAIPFFGTKGVEWILSIFTLYNQENQLQPLFFSRHMCHILGFKFPFHNKPQELIKSRKELGKKLKNTINWEKEWNDTLAPLYGKEYTTILPEIRKLLSGKFESTVFSVVSYGTVAQTTQKVCAIIEVKKTAQSRDAEKQHATYTIKRLYWL